MDTDSGAGSLDELDESECRRLLATKDVGRLAVVADGQPLVVPVNYVLDGDDIVFRSDPGTKLAHSSLDKVAFEVDELDPAVREGWSVLVRGVGREITSALDERSERQRALPLRTWVTGERGHWVRIVASEITGRRLRHSEAPAPPS
jgi:nitroimidazol reductase NimA-like FMN-containing flavoprotein (pyridoxamine 5'-phosphate oxidase superfamily)